MASGVDWMLTAIANFAGIKPDDLKRNLADMAQITVGIKTQLDRIETNQKLIMAHIIPPQPEATENVELIEYRPGQSNGRAEEGTHL